MPKERNKADDYREKAHQGDTKAMNNLGVCYERGTGVKVSLELAANGGDAQAQFATGWFQMTGNGAPMDEKKGLKWIHKATFQGYQPAIDYCKEHNIKWY